MTENSHPRLFLSDRNVEQWHARIDSDPQLSAFADYVIEAAEGLLEKPVLKRELEGRRLLGVSRECLHRLLYWGMAYRLTGDERYVARAQTDMLAVAAFKDWNPEHFLDVGEMTAGMGIGYDWFYHSLHPDARKTIQTAILNLGLKASQGKEMWWLSYANNWNQVCHSGLVIGALAIFKDAPQVSLQIVDRALQNVGAGLSTYAPDGAYPEGPGYWAYGTSYSVMMMAALESVLGSDFDLSEASGFLESATYILHAAGPSGQFFNYSDSGLNAGIRPEAYWFAQKLKQPELLWRERQNLKQFNDGKRSVASDKRLLPLLLVWAEPTVAESLVPEHLHWIGSGETPVAFHRSSWTDPKASFVAIKGGSPSVGHAHMDVGQFVMESDGVRWAVDLGTQPYHELEAAGLNIWGKVDRWKVFRFGNMSHSVLVVDEQPQVIEGAAAIVDSESNGMLSYSIIDSSELYGGQLKSAHRGVALHPNGAVQIEDQIETLQKQAEVRWAMVTYAKVTIESARRATLRQDGEVLSLEVVAPVDVQLEIFEIAQPPNDYDTPNPGAKMIGFTLSLKPSAKETHIRVVLIPGGPDAAGQNFPAMTDWNSSPTSDDSPL